MHIFKRIIHHRTQGTNIQRMGENEMQGSPLYDNDNVILV